MLQATHTVELDDHMRDVVTAVHGAVNRAMPHLKDDPKVVDKALQDCKEILNVIIEGNVSEWLK